MNSTNELYLDLLIGTYLTFISISYGKINELPNYVCKHRITLQNNIGI